MTFFRTFSRRILAPLASAAIFILIGEEIYRNAPTLEMVIVLWLLLLAVYLFIFEIFTIDVSAIGIMVLLGLLSWLLPTAKVAEPLIDNTHLFDGFSSNAVMSIIAVMIIGASLDKTGLMLQVAHWITQVGGRTERRIIPLISSTVGLISSFMQNVGAAALFLPVVNRISARTHIPLSRLLMPMGFCAICGGTITMVGSSPLILLNDLIENSNRLLPAEKQMQPFDLFAVAPVGLAIVLAAIVYFVFAGRYVLPIKRGRRVSSTGTMAYLRKVYGLSYGLNEVHVPQQNKIVGALVGNLESEFALRIVALREGGKLRIAPGGLAQDTKIEAGSYVAVMASNYALERFLEAFNLKTRPQLRVFAATLTQTKAGIAEIVVPPISDFIGKSIRDLWFRKTYGLTVLAIHRLGENITEGVTDLQLQSGDTLICHTSWENLPRAEKDRNMVVVTTEYPREELRPTKVVHALVFFSIALGLVLFTDLKLSIALLTGAIGMVLSGVLTIEEAYQSVSWKTVFLLASLIPLGLAMENSGAAAWIADAVLSHLGDVPGWILLTAVAILSTFFTLVMSNVGATVLLVPLAINIALGVGADPALYAVTVALATSNSFLIPTHQVNALIMGPGGYKVKDFMRAGGIMTVIFLVVMMIMVHVVF